MEGLAGVRIGEDGLSINPNIPAAWKQYHFQILYKNQPLRIEVNQNGGSIENLGSSEVSLRLKNQAYAVSSMEKIIF